MLSITDDEKEEKRQPVFSIGSLDDLERKTTNEAAFAKVSKVRILPETPEVSGESGSEKENKIQIKLKEGISIIDTVHMMNLGKSSSYDNRWKAKQKRKNFAEFKQGGKANTAVWVN